MVVSSANVKVLGMHTCTQCVHNLFFIVSANPSDAFCRPKIFSIVIGWRDHAYSLLRNVPVAPNKEKDQSTSNTTIQD